MTPVIAAEKFHVLPSLLQLMLLLFIAAALGADIRQDGFCRWGTAADGPQGVERTWSWREKIYHITKQFLNKFYERIALRGEYAIEIGRFLDFPPYFFQIKRRKKRWLTNQFKCCIFS